MMEHGSLNGAECGFAMEQLRILAFCDYYLPGFKAGGPLRTVANMVDHLRAQLLFRIITRDRDLGDVVPYPDLPRWCWQNVNQAQVKYFAPGQLTARSLSRLICETDHDMLYLNSLFSPRMTIVPLILRKLGRIPSRPVVLAPRGELSAGALRLRLPKKYAFLQFARAARLYDGVVWQASSALEEQDIHHWFGRRARVVVAPNLPALRGEDLGPRRVKQPGALRVVFLSRIGRKKNLDGALRLLAGIRGRIDFHTYGPSGDQDYRSECEKLILTLPGNIQLDYRNMLGHATVEIPEVSCLDLRAPEGIESTRRGATTASRANGNPTLGHLRGISEQRRCLL